MKRITKWISALLAAILLLQIMPLSGAEEMKRTVKALTTKTESIIVDEGESVIVEEVVSLRDEYTKHFRTDKGSFIAAQYSVPVHYLDENGEYQEIDNSLSDSTENGMLENKNAQHKIKLSKKSNGSKLVSIKGKGSEISWNFKGMNKVEAETVAASETDSEDKTAVKNAVSSAIYRDIFSEVDIEYILSGEKIKENIILKDKTAQNEFVYEFKAKGYEVSLEDKSVVFKSEDSDETFVFDAPVVYDNKGSVTDNYTLAISNQKNNKFTLSLTVSREWLDSEEREFPVIIDPQVTTKYTREGHSDTYVYEYSSTAGTNYNAVEHINAGIDRTGKRIRALFKFDNYPELKETDRIVKAYLRLHTVPDPVGEPNDFGPELQVGVYQITGGLWNSNTATWNNTFKNNSITFDSNCMDYKTITANGIYKFDITPAARNWYSLPDFSQNKGLVLKLVNEVVPSDGGNNQVYFYSTAHGFPSADTYPWGLFEYRNTNGLEDYYTYQSASSASGSAFINSYTGQTSWTHNLITYSDNFGIASVDATYNSSEEANTTVLGDGFSLNIFAKIELNIPEGSTSPDPIYTYKFIDGDGTVHYFCQNSDNEWVDEDDLGMTLDFNVKKITFTNKSVYEFHSDGYIKKMISPNGHYVEINQNQTSISVDNREVITLNYDSEGQNRKLISVSYKDKSPEETYSCPGSKLTSITYADGTKTKLSYSEFIIYTRKPDNPIIYKYKLTKISDPDEEGHCNFIEIGYSYKEGAYRATSLYQGSEGTNEKHGISGIVYDYNQTKFTYTDESFLVCQFDSYGRTVSAYDSYGNASAGTYVSETGILKNNLATSTDYSVPEKNLLLDGSFARGLNEYDCYPSGKISLDEEVGLKNPKSVKIIADDDNSYISAEPSAHSGGKQFTATAYVKAENVAGLGAAIRIKTQNGVTITGESINGTTNENTDNGFRRLTTTFYLDEGDIINSVEVGLYSSASGTLWVNSLSLTEGAYSGEINLLGGSTFEYSNLSDYFEISSASAVSLSNATAVSGTKSIKFSASSDSDVSITTYASTDGNFAGLEGDVFTFGGWAKANAIPRERDDEGEYKSGREFRIGIAFKNSDGAYEKEYYAEFNQVVNEWQFTDNTVKAPYNYSNIRIKVEYNNQANVGYFDDIFLVKGEQNTYDYDDNGNLISTIDKAEQESTFNYNSQSNLSSMVSPTGSSFYYEYDEKGNLVGAITNAGQNITIEYDKEGKGNPEKTEITTTVLSSGEAELNKEFYIKSVQNGKYLTAASASGGASLSLKNFDGSELQKFTFGINGDNKSIKLAGTELYLSTSGDDITLSATPSEYKIINFNGGVEYQLRAVSMKACGAVAFDKDDKIDHQSLGSEWDKTSESKFRWVFEVPEEKGKGDKIITSAEYIDEGRRTGSNTDSRGNEVSYEYDEYGNVTKTTAPDGSTIVKTYNDETHQLTSVSSEGATVSYEYNLNGSLKSIAQGGFSYIFTYDEMGRTNKVTVAGRTLVETAYDEFGRESQLTYGNGNSTTYTYDERHQVTSVTSTGDKTQSVTYKYDAKGNIIEKTGEHNNYKYLYDILGRLTSAYGREGHELSVEYDSFNRVISFKNYINGEGYETKYTYNNIKGIIEKTNSKNTAGETVFEKVYSYDDLGRLESYLYSLEGENNYTVTFDYLEGSEENSTTTLVKSMTIGGVVYEYTYDSLGNITEVAKTVGETTTVIQSYVYDSLNQLTRENNRETNQTVVFEYDNHGNILSKTVYPFTLAEIVSEGTTINYGYDSNWTDLLVNYNGQAISYDQIGNPLTYRDGFSFKWSGDRKLTSFTLNNGASYVNGSYIYDDNGIRVYKNINGNETKYYLNGSTILTEITNYGGITRRIDYIYDENGSVYGFSVDNKDYYYVKNIQGDIIGILDKTGNLLVEYVYDAYGVPTVSFPGITEGMTDAEKQAIYILGSNNPFRYRGYYYDTETGFYYLNSRYYDPVTGRFINADNVLSDDTLTGNQFAYCGNNSIVYADFNGMDAIYVVDYDFESGLPVVGHSIVYLQDADGNWYKTEFAGSKPKNAKVYTKKVSQDFINGMLNPTYVKGILGRNIVEPNYEYIYYYGDYTASLKYALESNDSDRGGYSFITNNCNHYSREVMRQSESQYKVSSLIEPIIITPGPRDYLNQMRLTRGWDYVYNRIESAYNEAKKIVNEIFSIFR